MNFESLKKECLNKAIKNDKVYLHKFSEQEILELGLIGSDSLITCPNGYQNFVRSAQFNKPPKEEVERFLKWFNRSHKEELND